ncbi:MAG: hypothetical protein R2752_09245 [Vicinamibacterales bacterium]
MTRVSIVRLVSACASACAVVVATAAPARAQTPEERVAARAVLTKQGDAAVMVLATMKTHIVVNGREQNRDVPLQSNGLVIDAAGLTVMPLSALEPGDLLTRSLSANAPPGQKIEVSSETTELRVRYSDGTEQASSVVLRDSDLDLVFLKPTEALTAPVVFVDAPSATAQPFDLLVALQRGPERDGWRTYSTFTFVQMAVERPRTFLSVPVSTLVGNGLGAAFFTPAGGFVGLYVRVGGSSSSPTGAIVSADDLREVAKQVK